jgi:hypothetical protein
MIDLRKISHLGVVSPTGHSWPKSDLLDSENSITTVALKYRFCFGKKAWNEVHERYRA